MEAHVDPTAPTRRTLSRPLAVCLGLALALTACPRSTRTGGSSPDRDAPGSEDQTRPPASPFPSKPTVEARRDPAADAALEQAANTAETAPPAKAAQSFLAVRKAYPATTAGQEALYRAGVLFYDSKDYVNARKSFNELLFENPLHPQAQDAKLRLGQAALETGAYRDAYQTLASLAERAEGPERVRLTEQAIRAAEGAGLYTAALTLAVRLAGDAGDGPARQAAVQRVEALVEGRADFLDIAKVADGLSPQNPAWPIITFKLARIYNHLRDWNNLEQTLNRFLAEAPQHPFAPQARELLARATRRVEVRPDVVGVLLPMSGRYKPFGDAVLKGMQLALAGSRVELVVKDTQGEAAAAGAAVEQLAFDEGAIAAVGPLLSDDAKRAALVAEELQLPILTLTRTEGITEIGPHVFRNMLTNSAQARALADYAMGQKGMKSFALLYPNIPYGVELANGFWDEVVERGGQIRGAESYGHDQTTFTTEAKKLVGRYYLEDRLDYVEGVREATEGAQDAFRRRKALEKLKGNLPPIIDFEAILIPDDWRRVSLVAPALAVEDIVTNACDPRELERIRKTTGREDLKTVTLLGTNQWSSPKGRSGLPELLERGGKFVTCSVFVDGFFVDSERPGTRRFVAAFRKANDGRDPGLLEAVGYDAGLMLRQVIEKQRPTSRAALRDALAGLKDFEGATGRTSFDDKREAQKPLFLIGIDSKGVTELEAPAPRASADGS